LWAFGLFKIQYFQALNRSYQPCSQILDHSTQEIYIQPAWLGPSFYTRARLSAKEKRLPTEPFMRLSTKGRYAVMAMADLAGNAGEGKPVALADIAQRQDISLSYLEQLFAKLRRGGLVSSVRGPGGGYRLSRPSTELRIADIIVAVDEPIAATRCKPGSSKGCTKTGARCVTHDLWEELGQQIHVFLSSVSLADVVERRVLGRARPCNDAVAEIAAE
jgi:Rrf2 family iron-sulfur cluster assembly transcriptional regulator